MKKVQKRFTTAVFIGITTLLIISIGVYLYQNSKSEKSLVAENKTETNIVSWKKYTNTKYGFEFEYPPYLGTLEDDTESIYKIDCSPKTPDVAGVYQELPLASFTYFSLMLVCNSVVADTDSDASRYGDKEKITVAGKDSFLYEYTSAVNYQILYTYVPLGNGLYLGMGRSYKAGSPEADIDLSVEDFKKMLSTLKFVQSFNLEKR